MTQSPDRKVVEWRDADARARAAEQAVTEVLFARDGQPPAAADLVRQARQLRQLADEKLKAAIAALDPKSRP